MINVSDAYKETLATARRNFSAIINITLADGTVLPQLTNANLRALSIEDAVSADESFTMLGSTIINQCTITLDNIDEDYSQYAFRGADVTIFLDYPLINGTTERIRKGTYFVDDAKYASGTVQLKCLDYMAKFNIPYTKSALAYPATVQDVIMDASITCGVSFVQTDVPHKSFVLPRKPTAEQTSFRQVLGYVAQIIGCYARCNRFGQLEFKWCDRNALETAYEFPDKTDIHNLVHNNSQTIAIEDITITGISIEIESSAFESTAQDETVSIEWIDGKLVMRYPSSMLTTIHSDETGHVIQQKDEDSDTEYYLQQDDLYMQSLVIPSESKDRALNKYMAGSDSYVISITKNELITNEIAGDIATWLALQIVGLRFRKATTRHLGNPTMEAGDVAIMWDRKGRHYPIIVTRTVFGIGALQTTVCGAENPQKNAVSQYSETTKTFIKLADQIRREKTTREIALQELAVVLANSPGLYSTIQPTVSGNIYYLHDKETLAESEIIWKMTAEAWGVSSDGGQTWNGGMTIDGDVIARILTATGVNADWINTGALSIRKMVSGTSKEVFYANVDTGAVRIVADEFSLSSGDTISSIAESILNSWVTNEFATVVDGLEEDIADAKIDTWYQTSDPSTNWTATEQAEHTGDIWYNSTAAVQKFYRWNGTAWNEITSTPPDAVFDTIDGKAQIFIAQPSPPYAIGDLWFNSSTSDIMTCIQDRATGSYTASDWEKRNKYTDDSAVTTLDSSLNQVEVFNRLTNNGETQGIYLQNGKLYLNFDYAVGQTLRLGGLNNANGILRIYDSDNTEVGLINNYGAEYKGVVWYRYGSTLQYHRDVNLSTMITRSTLAFFINGSLKSVLSHFPIGIRANSDRTTIYNAYISAGDVSDENTSPLCLNLGQNGFLIYMSARSSSSSSSYQSGTPVKLFYGKNTNAGITSTSSYGNGNSYAFIMTLAAEIRLAFGLFISNSISIIGSSYHFYENGVRVALASSSSKRYKHDITNLTDKNLDAHKLLKLKPKQFIYNEDAALQYADMRDELLPGFIAEEVDEIYPAAVIHNEEGEIESWDERRIIPGMLQLIQEQHEEIENLKATVSKLEALVYQLMDNK